MIGTLRAVVRVAPRRSIQSDKKATCQHSQKGSKEWNGCKQPDLHEIHMSVADQVSWKPG